MHPKETPWSRQYTAHLGYNLPIVSPETLSSSFMYAILPLEVMRRRPVQSGWSSFQSEALQGKHGNSHWKEYTYIHPTQLLAQLVGFLNNSACFVTVLDDGSFNSPTWSQHPAYRCAFSFRWLNELIQLMRLLVKKQDGALTNFPNSYEIGIQDKH